MGCYSLMDRNQWIQLLHENKITAELQIEGTFISMNKTPSRFYKGPQSKESMKGLSGIIGRSTQLFRLGETLFGSTRSSGHFTMKENDSPFNYPPTANK